MLQADAAPIDFFSLPALPREFYAQDTVEAARQLLNCVLIAYGPEGLTAGRIAETEAYTRDDPACHAYRGQTQRNATMFGQAGHAYIYFTYGMYHCFNAVTATQGVAEAVLVRAVQPLAGQELMAARRGLVIRESNDPGSMDPAMQMEMPAERLRAWVRQGRSLCGGPGKVCMAYGLSRAQDGLDLTRPGQLWIAPPLPESGPVVAADIVATTRIGISQGVDLPWRFYLRNELFLSRR
jgi:DNA-3-methyladenine glycosylase